MTLTDRQVRMRERRCLVRLCGSHRVTLRRLAQEAVGLHEHFDADNLPRIPRRLRPFWNECSATRHRYKSSFLMVVKLFGRDHAGRPRFVQSHGIEFHHQQELETGKCYRTSDFRQVFLATDLFDAMLKDPRIMTGATEW